MEFEEVGQGVLKRKERRVLGLFIDGAGLDRAARRLKRKVHVSRLMQGVTSGATPVVARYYTILPYEDDSRQHAFLDAMERAGLEVVSKRLPPKGVTRQVTTDVEMVTDLIAFALGKYSKQNGIRQTSPEKRIATVVCPSRDLAYPITLIKKFGVDTVTADFGQFRNGDILKSAAKWIDLSDSKTIWR